LSYAIKGSLDAAKKLAKYANSKGIKNIHVCTATLKDRYQLRRRIKRRALNAKKDYDFMTGEGMLIRGAIYYQSENPERIISWLKKEFEVPTVLLHIDDKRKRILTRIDVVKELGKEIKKRKLKPAIVEEYPTHDCFPIEINYL
jgi:pyruvate formate-lyase activating enzyme-like uncharacterized protein